MASATIDHMVSITVFIAALLIFMNLFGQTIQTAVVYKEHQTIASKASDLLDSILLNSGTPVNWGRGDSDPTGFGLQDPEFTQYRVSPYSLMRLESSIGEPIYYEPTGQYYSNLTMDGRDFLLVSNALSLNYSYVTQLLGINGTYGFQLDIVPIVTVSITETSAMNPLTLQLTVSGTGFPLANAEVSYCFLKVDRKGSTPYYSTIFGSTVTDNAGQAIITVNGIQSTDSYAFIAYARTGGLVGVGYHHRTNDAEQYIIPFVDSFDAGRILLAHSYDVHTFENPASAVFYNATFVLMSEDFTLKDMFVAAGQVDKVVYGSGSSQTFQNMTIPTSNPGILVVTYQTNNGDGVVMMPWGMSALSFPVSFGADIGVLEKQEWVSTDTRLVLVGGVQYQAKLSLWSYEGQQVVG